MKATLVRKAGGELQRGNGDNLSRNTPTPQQEEYPPLRPGFSFRDKLSRVMVSPPANSDRFSLLYIARGAPSSDSPRARYRFTGFLQRVFGKYRGSRDTFIDHAVHQVLEVLGHVVPYQGNFVRLCEFIKTCELRDFQDIPTIIYEAFRYADLDDMSRDWVEFVNRVFDEENLSYRADERGVVHFRVDEECERNFSAAAAVLRLPRYGAAEAAFQRARDFMAQADPNGLDALRNLFEAAEAVFKGTTGSGAALDAGEVKRSLRPLVERRLGAIDEVARRSALRFTEAFADWVDAAHPYRHGHDAPSAIEPPLALAVGLMSAGASYIRWMAEFEPSE